MDESCWYCVRTKPKTENSVAGLLRLESGLEVFCPMLRYEKARRSGKAWVREALFPGYVFARFSYLTQRRMVEAVSGVRKVVVFGDQPGVVPEGLIAELRLFVQDSETVVIAAEPQVGETVKVVTGPFRGIEAVVTRVLPKRERVAILLELLGMEREVEVPSSAVLADVEHPIARRGA